MNDMFDNDFDPMRDLEDLKEYTIDLGIKMHHLTENQKVLVECINDLRKDMALLTEIFNQVTRK